MIRVKPDVLITIAWCVFGMVYRMLPFELGRFREITIVLLIIFSRKKMKLGNMHIVCIMLCFYYFLISVFHEGLLGSLQSSISMISWIVTLLVYTAYSKDKEDLKLIFNVLIYTSLFVAVIFLLNNKFFSNEITVSLNNGVIVNRNSILYYVFPGYLLSLLKVEREKRKKIIDIFILLVLLFACLQVNSRTMYLSLMITSLCIFSKQIWALIRRRKMIGLVFFFIVIGVSIYMIFTILPDEYISREFGNGMVSTDTGRIDLWKEAIGMVDNPLFGMGPSYYENHVSYSFADYGAHNIFVDLYVSIGILGSALFIAILLFFIKKNMYILAIVAPAVLTFSVEAGRIFFPYMLLIIAWFIIVGAKESGQSIDDYLENVFNDDQDREYHE